MNKHEIAQLVACLTDDELTQLREVLANSEDSDPRGGESGRFAKSLFGGGNGD